VSAPETGGRVEQLQRRALAANPSASHSNGKFWAPGLEPEQRCESSEPVQGASTRRPKRPVLGGRQEPLCPRVPEGKGERMLCAL
jgi:hypothetical protein